MARGTKKNPFCDELALMLLPLENSPIGERRQPLYDTKAMPKKVIVIGAGAAGLSAAQELKKAKFDVRVLEARARVGGRIHTDHDFVNFPLELGAEFVHGENAVTWKYLESSKLKAVHDGDYSTQAYEHPKKGLLSYKKICKLPDYAKVFELEEKQMPLHDPVKDFSLREWMKKFNLAAPAREFALRFLAHQYLTEPEKIGIGDLAHEERVYHQGDDDFRILEGQDKLMEHMAKGLKIELNSPVTKIEWNKKGVKVFVEGQKKALSADRVVITVPLPLLKKGVLFKPALPREKLKAIDSLRMGQGMKIHMAFKKAFWGKKFDVFFSLGNISMWWSPSSAYKKATPVLTGLVGGMQALALNELPEEVILIRAQEELCRLFRSEAPHKYFLKGKVVSWIDDPWTQGGYTYVPSGAYGAREMLAKPVDAVLFFAGEATVFESNPATVHGAIGTGLRAAREVMESVKQRAV